MPDEQLSLFGDLGTSRHKRVLNQQQTAPVTDAPAKPAYDHNQLQLIVNPTEQVARTYKSTDMSVLGRERGYGITQEDIAKVGAPSEDMRRLGAVKEYEARQPTSSGLHGSGVSEIFSSGDQVRNPIEEWIEGEGPEQRRQYQGHHRLFAGAAHERETGQQGSIWMPISYTDKTPKPPPPEKDFKGRRLARWADPQHTDVAEGAEQVYGGPGRRVGTTEGYRFAADVDAARGVVHGLQRPAGRGVNRKPMTKQGEATDRQDAIKAAVLYGQARQGPTPEWPEHHMGIHTAANEAVAQRKGHLDAVAALASTTPSNRQGDSSLERLLAEWARRAPRPQKRPLSEM